MHINGAIMKKGVYDCTVTTSNIPEIQEKALDKNHKKKQKMQAQYNQ